MGRVAGSGVAAAFENPPDVLPATILSYSTTGGVTPA
jgi:hypothetical protein